MTLEITPYSYTHRDPIIRLFDAFQDFLVQLDPLHRLIRLPGYGENAVANTLQDVEAQRGIFYVALDGDTVVGFIVGIIEPQSASDLLGVIPSPPGRMTQLYVDAAHRGKGIATQLMREAEAYLRQQGCAVVKVEVFVPNEAARKLYQKLGYLPRDIDNMKQL